MGPRFDRLTHASQSNKLTQTNPQGIISFPFFSATKRSRDRRRVVQRPPPPPSWWRKIWSASAARVKHEFGRFRPRITPLRSGMDPLRPGMAPLRFEMGLIKSEMGLVRGLFCWRNLVSVKFYNRLQHTCAVGAFGAPSPSHRRISSQV